jgi:hypothetical protein
LFDLAIPKNKLQNLSVKEAEGGGRRELWPFFKPGSHEMVFKRHKKSRNVTKKK